MNIFKNVKILAGNDRLNNYSFKPFDKRILNFIALLSKNIQINKLAKDYTDVLSFAFFCRERNLIALEKNYSNLKIRKGLGISFHITPANIPTNFAYSLIFGLLSGNCNIVKVPSKNFPQIEIICKEINRTLSRFPKLKDHIKIIRYSRNDEFTKNISLISDARLIWGGNKTIEDAKSFKTKPNNRDLYFADKNSFCVINFDEYKKLKIEQIKLLALNFYNDTYLVDQNACSSPHVIFWLSKKRIENKIKEKFWLHLNNLIEKKYNFDFSASFFKYDRSIDDYLSKKNIKIINNSNIYRVQFSKDKIKNLDTMKAKWGYFYETNINDIKELFRYSNDSTQTLSYFGFEQEYLKELLLKKTYKGIDRAVKIGQALNISLFWDGYDIISNLTKVKDVR